MDWLYPRPANLEQERVSGVTGNPPETAIVPRAGGAELGMVAVVEGVVEEHPPGLEQGRSPTGISKQA